MMMAPPSSCGARRRPAGTYFGYIMSTFGPRPRSAAGALGVQSRATIESSWISRNGVPPGHAEQDDGNPQTQPPVIAGRAASSFLCDGHGTTTTTTATTAAFQALSFVTATVLLSLFLCARVLQAWFTVCKQYVYAYSIGGGKSQCSGGQIQSRSAVRVTPRTSPGYTVYRHRCLRAASVPGPPRVKQQAARARARLSSSFLCVSLARRSCMCLYIC